MDCSRGLFYHLVGLGMGLGKMDGRTVGLSFHDLELVGWWGGTVLSAVWRLAGGR